VVAAVHQHLQSYAHRQRPRTPARRAELAQLLAVSQQAVQEVRQVIAGLRPTVLDDFGLAAALRHEVEVVQAAGWRVRYRPPAHLPRLPAPVETTLFRVAQEALTNIRKHAGRTVVFVGLRAAWGRVWLVVRDQGAGFAAADWPRGRPPGAGLGLVGMEERVRLLGGQFRLRSRPGGGTRLAACIPVATVVPSPPAPDPSSSA
jgi:signal transduction histidine kinase